MKLADLIVNRKDKSISLRKLTNLNESLMKENIKSLVCFI